MANTKKKTSAKKGATKPSTKTSNKGKAMTKKSSKVANATETVQAQTATVTTPPPTQQTSSKDSAMNSIAEGYGFATFWKNVSFGYKPVSQLEDARKTAPLKDFVSFDAHTTKQAIQLACTDGSLKRIKHNDEKVEAKLHHYDETGKTYTVVFLGYEKVDNQKGKRTQIDRVVINEDGSFLDSGSTDVGSTYLGLFQKHLDNWTGNDIYLQVIRPYLTDMKAFRLSTSNYYVSNTQVNRDKLAELRLFLESVGFQLFTLTQAKDTATQFALTEQVKDMLGERITDVASKVAEWKSKNRVHGRSEKAVLDELSSILADAKELETNLETELQGVKDQLASVEQEAVAILSNQAPKEYNPLAYQYFQGVLSDEKNMCGEIASGKLYMITIGNDNHDFFISSGTDVKKYVKRMLRTLGDGYWAFVSGGVCILRPLAEIEAFIPNDQAAK